jgi:probable HAF family extracellular repeat protein
MGRFAPNASKLAFTACAVMLLFACGRSDDGPQQLEPATFTGIGTLPGYRDSGVSALSANGGVAVGEAYNAAGGGKAALRWQAASGVSAIGFLPGGTTSTATAVSASGDRILVSGNVNIDGIQGSAMSVWSLAEGFLAVDPLASSTLCSASGLSGDGTVVVGVCLVYGNTAFRWTRGVGTAALRQFGTGSNMQSAAVAISRDGGTVVGVGHPVLTGAVAWAADGSAKVLGKLPDDSRGFAAAVSDDGQVIVGTSFDAGNVPHAFRWTESAGMTSLGEGNGVTSSHARTVSGNGAMVGGCGSTAAGDVAVLWDAGHGMRTLTDMLSSDHGTVVAGWTLSCISAMSTDGRVLAGYGINPQGRMEGWIVRLPAP